MAITTRKSSIIGLALLFLLSCHPSAKITTENSTEEIALDSDLRIAFGSCSHQDENQSYWKAIGALDPEAWIWLGDIIYGDSEDPQVLKEKYDKLASNSYYQAFAKKNRIYGIWDDHDYGANNAGREYPSRQQSRDLLLEFLDVPQKKWPKEGAYQSYEIQEELDIKLILLDTRYFRDPVEYKNRKPIPNESGTILGEDQWRWLENELKNASADLYLIGSGVQIIPEDHRFEKWANFPKERERLFDLIVDYQLQNVVFLSGDRHVGEVSKIVWKGTPLYEVTSSGLTHSYEEAGAEVNRHRIGDIMNLKNAGLIQYTKGVDSLSLEIRRIDGALWQRHKIPLLGLK